MWRFRATSPYCPVCVQWFADSERTHGTLRGPSVTFYPRVLKRCQSQKGNRLDDVLLLVPAGNTLVCVHVSAVTHLSALLFCGVCTLSLIAGGYPSIMAVTHVHDALKYCQNLKHDACTHARMHEDHRSNLEAIYFKGICVMHVHTVGIVLCRCMPPLNQRYAHAC